MMKRKVIAMVAATLFISLVGCKKEVTTMPEEQVDTVVVVDTPDNTWDVDTTPEVIFEERDLEAEFQARVKENLQTVHFEYNSYTLTPESQELLLKAAKFLQAEARLRVKIEGHTDERGSTDYNLALGEKRAAAVRDYFIRYGIEPIRLEITSYGKEKLLQFGCGSEECHFNNRRAEYVVIR